jgi:hypothetical protein
MPAGAIVSCPNDHWLYRLRNDVHRMAPIKAADFEVIDDSAQDPQSGMPIKPCPYCGAKFFVIGRMHFAGVTWTPGEPQMPNERKGWWPSAPSST